MQQQQQKQQQQQQQQQQPQQPQQQHGSCVGLDISQSGEMHSPLVF